MPATGQKVRVGAIVQGGTPTIEQAWRAVALLEARLNALLVKLDADAVNTALNDTDYEATLGTAAAERAIVD